MGRQADNSRIGLTKVMFQDPGITGLGRVSAAVTNVSFTMLRPRRIDCYALVYLTAGSGQFRDDRGTAHRMTAGDAFLLFPGLGHSYGPGAGETWEEVYILFEGPLFNLWNRHHVLDPHRPLYRLDPVSRWEPRIRAVWDARDSALDRVVRLQDLLAEMTRSRNDLGTDQTEKDWLKTARERLRARMTEPRAAQAVAGETGMSYETFRKTFSRLQGCGPSRYCLEKAIETAASRLLTESTPLKQLAEELGFSDEFHFSKRFKQHLGIAPGAYRRRAPAGR